MKKTITMLLMLALALLLCLQTGRFLYGWWREISYRLSETTQAEQLVYTYAQDHHLSYSDYPESLIELLNRNPETSKFVLEYPEKHDQDFDIDLSEYKNSAAVPLFLQWDQRWGYTPYGSDVAGLTGCGPVCLAMAGFYLTGDERFSPDQVLEFAKKEGYCVPGNGTSWKLISEGGEKLGLDVEELPLHQSTMEQELEKGYPIICVMGPGDFTSSGHYIVLTGVQDDAFTVNDPNSQGNSEKLWTYQQIQDQIRNLWVIRPGTLGES